MSKKGLKQFAAVSSTTGQKSLRKKALFVKRSGGRRTSVCLPVCHRRQWTIICEQTIFKTTWKKYWPKSVQHGYKTTPGKHTALAIQQWLLLFKIKAIQPQLKVESRKSWQGFPKHPEGRNRLPGTCYECESRRSTCCWDACFGNGKIAIPISTLRIRRL